MSAEPGERAIILADGLDAVIDVVRQAELPSAPVELVGGIRERREQIVRDADSASWVVLHRGGDRGAYMNVYSRIWGNVVEARFMCAGQPLVGPISTLMGY